MKQVLVIYNHDNLANSKRAQKTKYFLEKAGFRVKLFDAVIHVHDYYKWLGRDTFWSWLRYHLRFLEPVYYFWWPYYVMAQYPLYSQLMQRGKMIARFIKLKTKTDIVICQSSYDIASLLFIDQDIITICDLPNSLFLELKFSKKIIQKELEKIKKIEQKVYNKASKITFHWPSIQSYLQKKLNLDKDKMIGSGWGVDKKSVQAKFSSKPKIVFLGNLDDYWINKKLLLSLISNSKFQIDLFGKTSDERIKKLSNYHGYLPELALDTLAEYQFGLITLSKDKLRKKSFSAKHLMYYSYGLPVLVPDWRSDSHLDAGTIPFQEKSFNEVVKAYLTKKKWQQKSQAALKIANDFTWRRVFKEMIDYIKDTK